MLSAAATRTTGRGMWIDRPDMLEGSGRPCMPAARREEIRGGGWNGMLSRPSDLNVVNVVLVASGYVERRVVCESSSGRALERAECSLCWLCGYGLCLQVGRELCQRD